MDDQDPKVMLDDLQRMLDGVKHDAVILYETGNYGGLAMMYYTIKQFYGIEEE